MPKTSNSVHRHLQSLINELTELRAVKSAYENLSKSYNELTRLVARVTGVNLGTGRGPGRPKGSKNRNTLARTPGRRGKGGKRYRSSAAEVQKAYEALAAKATKEWKTKEEICKAAGYRPEQVVAAWKRLMEGGKDADGKPVKPLLESNGSRGLSGRYRRRG